MTAWLTIVGIGEDGLEGAGSIAQNAIDQAEYLFGGERHLNLIGKKGVVWKTPLRESFAELDKLKGKNVVVVATGDPMWFGIGATLGRRYGLADIRIIPSPSAFSYVAARMVWPLSEVECLTVHGRDINCIRSFILPANKIIALANDGESPAQIAALLASSCYGNSTLVAFSHLGGAHESRFEGIASNWDYDVIPDLNSIAIECLLDRGVEPRSRIPGLPDEVFEHDGQLTKSEVRAITVSALAPMPGQMLWDIGAGCGSVSIEWLRATANARAFAIEKNMDRLETIKENALALGTPELKVVFGEALKELLGLPAPDAIFIGGGLTSDGLVEYCWQNLKPGGRLVANVVTFEGERLLADIRKKLGGDLRKIEISRADSVGEFSSWQPSKPITQLRIIKE